MTFCTLFNINYLDKGLALYDSLELVTTDFCLYVLAMDDKCYEVLCDIKRKKLVPIKLEDFETEELVSVKKDRKLGEYFWTCSSWIISYILDNYSPEYCTYLDADLFFYSDPSVIITEMKRKRASVQVISHHFIKLIEEETSRIVGKYCVECNTFRNDRNGRMLLDIWKRQVIEHCSLDGDGVYWGDQKYLDNWVDDYDFVIASDNIGAGVAPWNISQYIFSFESKDNGQSISVKRNSRKEKLLFYHFENIEYIDDHTVNASLVLSWGINKHTITSIYIAYLEHQRSIKTFLSCEYGIDILLKSHPGVNIDNGNPKRLHFNFRNKIKRLLCLFSLKKGLLFSIKYRLTFQLPRLLYKKYSIIKF